MKKKQKTSPLSERDKLLSYFSCFIGSWNGSAGFSPGRLRFEPDYENDEEIELTSAEEKKILEDLWELEID